jgi:hypothetical protein
MGPHGASRPIPSEFSITLEFDKESRIAGKSACNSYFATYHIDGSHLRFRDIGSTRMACPGMAMALERDYLAALERVETYHLQADRLTLYYDQGKNVLLFRNPTELPQEAIGRSSRLSFDEAFADAIKNLPPRTPSHPDELEVVTIVEIKAEFGGIAGLHDLLVRVRRTTQ